MDGERALAAGEITVDHVELLSQCNTTDLAEVFADSERRLVDKARVLRFVAFEKDVRYWRDIVDPDGAGDTADAKLADRHRHESKSVEDMVRADGWLDPVGGSICLNELGRLEGWLFDQDWVEATARLGEGNVTAAGLRRTPAQRRADAQVLMAVRSASMTATGTPFRPVLNVVMDWATFCAELARRPAHLHRVDPPVLHSRARVRRALIPMPDRSHQSVHRRRPTSTMSFSRLRKRCSGRPR